MGWRRRCRSRRRLRRWIILRNIWWWGEWLWWGRWECVCVWWRWRVSVRWCCEGLEGLLKISSWTGFERRTSCCRKLRASGLSIRLRWCWERLCWWRCRCFWWWIGCWWSDLGVGWCLGGFCFISLRKRRCGTTRTRRIWTASWWWRRNLFGFWCLCVVCLS